MIQSNRNKAIIPIRQPEAVAKCSNLNQGGFKLHYSKRLITLADNIISQEATYTPDEGYALDYDSIDENDIEMLCAQLMADDQDIACEATGADNPAYLTKMLPALITYIKTCSDENSYEFATKWREGIANYLRTPLKSLLDDRLEVHEYYMSQEATI